MAEHARKHIELHREIRDGYQVLVEENGLVRFTRNPKDRPAETRPGFDLNRQRLRSIERLIADRHGGSCYDREFAFGYATVATVSLTMARVVRGWKPSHGPAKVWIEFLCPCLSPEEADEIIERIARRPRGQTARRAGLLVNVMQEEIDRLALRTLAPADKSAAQINRERRERKNRMDRERNIAARRAKGVRPIEDVSAGSVAAFCRDNGIHRSSFRKAAERGAEALRAFLVKKGINEIPANWEKWPELSAPNRYPTDNNTATALATFDFSQRSAELISAIQTANLGARALRFQFAIADALLPAAIAVAKHETKRLRRTEHP